MQGGEQRETPTQVVKPVGKKISTLADDPQFQNNDLKSKLEVESDDKASTRDAAFPSTNTEDSQASILESAAPGNVVFEIDGKRVDLVVAKEEVDLSLEPGDTSHPPYSGAISLTCG